MASDRTALTRDRILDTALAIVARDGLAALSMRRLGEEVGVEAMSLYHHVPSKAALLDGVHERILARVPPPPAHEHDWRRYAAHQAQALHATLCAHPGAIGLFVARPAATASSLARLDAYLDVLVRAGFSRPEAVQVVHVVMAFVVGHASWAVGPAHGEPPAAEFRFGLDALLTGLAARLRRSRTR